MKITMLGCGSSAGIPFIGCTCAVCTSTNPKNKRLRVSVYVETEDKKILIDTSPDLRQQAIANQINHIDAVLYTHDHADHTHGIDDLRSFNYLCGKEIPIYGNAELLSVLKQRFAYTFLPKPEQVWRRPALIPNQLPDLPVYEFKIGESSIVCFEQLHGKSKTLGYRIGNFAYSTDTDQLPESAFEALAGVKIWFVDCLRYSQSYSHSNLENTLRWIERVKPQRAVLTHMAHDFDYDTLKSELPAGVEPGYDGLVVEC